MEVSDQSWIAQGGVTSPLGFQAGGIATGIKTYGAEPRLDVGLLCSTHPCTAAGLFTQNQICGAPVTVSRQHLQDGRLRAIAVNSGCSNVGRGAAGVRDARSMAAAAAQRLGLGPDEVGVASTGVIAQPLPLDRVLSGVQSLELSDSGGEAFARSIMTTDRVPKQRALSLRCGSNTYRLGAAAKGSGMAQPNMATVLTFVTSDAPLNRQWAQATLKRIADETLNMLNIDLDTSTSDSLFLLANGTAGGSPIDEGHPAAAPFERALRTLCLELTRDLARDGEGARTLLEVRISGARSTEEARAAAHTVVSSPLVKTMIAGRDPNAGRVLMALGRSPARVEEQRVSLSINGSTIYRDGELCGASAQELKSAMEAPEVVVCADLGLGAASAQAWGCDLTQEYVHINADYTT